jgi:hypothetical protein
VRELITTTTAADAADLMLFIKGPGDASIEMSSEGAASTRYRGFSATTGFLEQLKLLAIEELGRRRKAIVAELAGLGVEAEE